MQNLVKSLINEALKNEVIVYIAAGLTAFAAVWAYLKFAEYMDNRDK